MGPGGFFPTNPDLANILGRTDFDLGIFTFFEIFPAHAKNWSRWPQMGPGGFFPANPDLADILGDMDFDFENLDFLIFGIPDFQISGFPDSWIPRFKAVI